MPSTTKQLFKNVHGVAFAPTKTAKVEYRNQGYTIFFGKEKWCDANSPDNCIVYDFIDALLAMNLPLLDTVHTQAGLFVRRHPMIEPKPYEPGIRIYPGRVNATGEMCILSLHDETLVEIPNRISIIREDVVANKGSISRGIAKRVKPAKEATS